MARKTLCFMLQQESRGLGHAACRAQVSCQRLAPATCHADVSRGHGTPQRDLTLSSGSALPAPLLDPSACHVLCPCTVGSDYTPRAILWRQPAHAQWLSLSSPGLRPAGLSPEPGIRKLHSRLSVWQGGSPGPHRAELRFKDKKMDPT